MIARTALSWVLLALAVVLPAQADAATIYAADGSSTLYTLDPTTGAATSVGTSNFVLQELAFHPNGTLYGIGHSGDFVDRIITIDTSTAQATQVTSSVTALGSGSRWQGIVDMTFDAGGNLYLAHHRHGGSGSGVGVYSASLVDGSAGASAIAAAQGGFSIGTLDNGNLLQWGYQIQNETTFAGVAQSGFPSLTNAAGQTCSVPTGPGGNEFRPLAVEAGSGLAWAFDPVTCGLVRVDIATGQTTGIGDPSGLGFLTGIAVTTVPEPSAAALLLVAGIALARRRPWRHFRAEAPLAGLR